VPGFTCGTCGEYHEGLPDIAFDAPYYYYGVPEAGRADRCVLDSDSCTIDGEHFFVRGCLEIPVHGQSEHFAWGAWLSLSRRNFQRFLELPGAERPSSEGSFVGWLSVRIPGYPDTLKLKARAHPRGGGFRPRLELEPTDHPLAVEQREGIGLDRLQQIYEQVLHPETPPA
jgi:hypothetical protein